MCFAFLALLVSFTISGNVTSPPELCKFFSALLHYLLLVYFFWTAAEARYLHYKLVEVFNNSWIIRNYTLISMPICWSKY